LSCSNNFSIRISFKCRRYNTHVVSYNMPCARSLHKYIITSMHIILIGQKVDDNAIVSKLWISHYLSMHLIIIYISMVEGFCDANFNSNLLCTT
jgi:hypothetical protein